MWMVDPQTMCRKHLLGEHVECHMLAGCLRKGKSLTGYIADGLVEIRSLSERHNELAAEIVRRGYNHRTPIEDVAREGGMVDRIASCAELHRRCGNCRDLWRRKS